MRFAPPFIDGGSQHHLLALLTGCCAFAWALGALAQEPVSPVQVKIQDEKPADPELVFAIDPVQHIQLTAKNIMAYGIRVDNQNLSLEWMYNWFNIDGMVTYPGNAASGRFVKENQPLPKTSGDRPRVGHVSVWEFNKLTFTQEVEVVATKSQAGANRRRDAVLVRYLVENKDTVPHKIGVRPHWNDVTVMNNKAALYAAPNHPNKILDGVELKGDKVPNYVQLLQKPDLKNPGFVAHLTFHLGAGFERPDRVVLTRGGALSGDKWDATVAPAGGNSGLVLYWDPKEIKPGGQRKMAYAFGQGIALRPDGEGDLAIALTGSFEPGKLFTIAVQVMDPAAGQSLTLELPPGMERVEGKERQSVPAVDTEGNTMVLWKARVLNTGQFALRVRSSTGVTATKIITITRPAEKS
jgi:hypothetical protein